MGQRCQSQAAGFCLSGLNIAVCLGRSEIVHRVETGGLL